jgi:hypothetical protein
VRADAFRETSRNLFGGACAKDSEINSGKNRDKIICVIWWSSSPIKLPGRSFLPQCEAVNVVSERISTVGHGAERLRPHLLIVVAG